MKVLLCVIAWLVVAAPGGSAVATPLPLGGTVTVGFDESLAPGSTRLLEMSPGVGAPTFDVILSTAVYVLDRSNPFFGGLTFTYDLRRTDLNWTSGALPITRLQMSGFAGVRVDVKNYNAGGNAAVTADRSDDGDVIGINYLPPPDGLGSINQGERNRWLVFHTDARDFRSRPNSVSVMGGTTVRLDSFVPVPLPEPSGAAVLAFALVFLRRPGRNGRAHRHFPLR